MDNEEGIIVSKDYLEEVHILTLQMLELVRRNMLHERKNIIDKLRNINNETYRILNPEKEA